MDAASLAGRMQGWTPFDSSPPPQPESDASSPTMNMSRTDRMSPVKLMGGSPGRDAKMPIGPPVMHKPHPYHAQGVSTSPNGQGAGNGMQTIGRMGQQRQGLPGPPIPSGMFGLESGIGGPPLVNPGPGQFGQSLSPFDGQLGCASQPRQQTLPCARPPGKISLFSPSLPLLLRIRSRAVASVLLPLHAFLAKRRPLVIAPCCNHTFSRTCAMRLSSLDAFSVVAQPFYYS